MDHNSISAQLNNFKKLVQSSSDPSQITPLVNQLKIASIIYLAKPETSADVNDKVKQDLVLARDILECLSLYSIKIKDLDSFDRYYSQLKTYYYDYKKFMNQSSVEHQVIGLYLMRLLTKHQTSLFHSELELISLEDRENPFIKFPLLIEKSMTEGSYNKVVQSKSVVPSEYYQCFLDILAESIKEDIANCSEKSFKTLSLKDAEKVLLFNNSAQFNQYVKSRNWTVQGDKIKFSNNDNAAVEIPSIQLIHQTLHYAKELERIV
ncbi:hypothetical protein CYY_004006 [Polysphondylium violaceum]|uniref:PCI domain-containing protein n=1 Tax=Polysphondylium violaceum TaxID=133409 RepID=A0A8J4PVX6_9MYCE|nr:hypothetical protein CYY_004006 [Polysphondylium violaceum]